jgi:MYXO-CTERM domain-containing protein
VPGIGFTAANPYTGGTVVVGAIDGSVVDTPSALALLALGLAGIALIRFRRNAAPRWR